MENGSDGRRRDRKDAAHESEMDRGGAVGVRRTGEAKRVGGLSRPLWFILFKYYTKVPFSIILFII